MVGSNRPRLSLNKVRTGRPPTIHVEGEDGSPPDSVALPTPSTFYVVGRATVFRWTREERNRFVKMAADLRAFGLAIVEQEVADSRTGKLAGRRWSRHRISAWVLKGTISDEPGVLFDDLARMYLDDYDPVTEAAFDAARQALRSAIYKIVKAEGAITRTARLDGFDRLWLTEDVPGDLAPDAKAPTKEPHLGYQHGYCVPSSDYETPVEGILDVKISD